MKLHALLTLILFCFNLYAFEYLALLDESIDKDTYHLLQHVDNHYLALISDADHQILQQRGQRCKIVDTDPENNIYYLVYPSDEEEKLYVSSVAQSLAEFDECLLVRIAAAKEDLLLDLRGDLDFIEFDKLEFESVVLPEMVNIEVTYNPLIQQMVDAVSEDTLEAWVRHLEEIPTRHASYEDNVKIAVPWIMKKLKEFGCDSVYSQKVPSYKNAPNPIGIKLGKKNPSYTKYVLIGGHPDCMPRGAENFGADDNGTGTAGFMEAARTMQNYTFENTIVYMGFNAEEVGLRGSAEYAKIAKNRGDTILGVINFDMIGHSGQYERLKVSYNPNVSGCKNLGDTYEKAASTYTKLDFQVVGDSDGRSDHVSFWNKGFPALKNIEYEKSSKVYHTLKDKVGHPDGLNNFAYFRRNVQAGIATIAVIAKVIDQTPITSDFSFNYNSQAIAQIKKNSQQEITITFLHNNSGPCVATIVNPRGQLISKKVLTQYNHGETITLISGKQKYQKQLGTGVYLVKLSTPGLQQKQKIIIQ